jgi:hypothetical protein
MSKQNQHPGSVRPGILVVAAGLALCTLTLQAQEQAPSAADETTPSAFRLSVQGLPEDGLFKGVPILTDINGDTHLDLIAHERKGSGARVWLGDGAGAWKEESNGLTMREGSCGGGVDVADVNGDGHPDMAVADHCNGIYVYLGDGKGGWQSVTSALAPASAGAQDLVAFERNLLQGAEDLSIGDVNEDGKLDIVAVSSDQGGFAVYLGNGTGQVWREMRGHGLPSGEEAAEDDPYQAGFANELVMRDMNGDGHLDVVAAYFHGPRVWVGDGQGKWKPAFDGLPPFNEYTDAGGLYRRITVGDLNGDGRQDLAVTHVLEGLHLYMQTADGKWEKADLSAVAEVSGGAEGVGIGDLDGDGKNEVVVAARVSYTEGYGIIVVKRQPDGGWKAVPGLGLPQTLMQVTWGVLVADVNHDQRNDILVVSGGAMNRPKKDGLQEPGKDGQPPQLPRIVLWLNQMEQGASTSSDEGRPAAQAEQPKEQEEQATPEAGQAQ